MNKQGFLETLLTWICAIACLCCIVLNIGIFMGEPWDALLVTFSPFVFMPMLALTFIYIAKQGG